MFSVIGGMPEQEAAYSIVVELVRIRLELYRRYDVKAKLLRHERVVHVEVVPRGLHQLRFQFTLRMLQKHDQIGLLCMCLITSRNQKHSCRDSPVLHTLYSEHKFKKPIEKTHTRRTTKI